MGYKPLVTAWRESRAERTEMQPGPRVASMEHDVLPVTPEDGPVDMSPGRDPGWHNLFGLLASDPQPDGVEHEDDGPEVQA